MKLWRLGTASTDRLVTPQLSQEYLMHIVHIKELTWSSNTRRAALGLDTRTFT